MSFLQSFSLFQHNGVQFTLICIVSRWNSAFFLPLYTEQIVVWNASSCCCFLPNSRSLQLKQMPQNGIPKTNNFFFVFPYYTQQVCKNSFYSGNKTRTFYIYITCWKFLRFSWMWIFLDESLEFHLFGIGRKIKNTNTEERIVNYITHGFSHLWSQSIDSIWANGGQV